MEITMSLFSVICQNCYEKMELDRPHNACICRGGWLLLLMKTCIFQLLITSFQLTCHLKLCKKRYNIFFNYMYECGGGGGVLHHGYLDHIINTWKQVKFPVLLSRSTYSALWYKPDTLFSTPKANVKIDFNCPYAGSSPEAEVLVHIFTQLLMDYLNDYGRFLGIDGLCFILNYFFILCLLSC